MAYAETVYCILHSWHGDAGLAGCLWWSKRDAKSQKGQAVGKSASGVPFNMDLDSARGPGPQDPEDPKELVIHPEPDHTPEGKPLQSFGPLIPGTFHVDCGVTIQL